MIKNITYTKESGDTSRRSVYPLNIVYGDKLLCVDLTEFDSDEVQEYEAILDQIHKDYIQAIKDAGLGSTFRTFLIERIS